MENDIVKKRRPLPYNPYGDDNTNRQKKNQVDLLFNDLNNYH